MVNNCKQINSCTLPDFHLSLTTVHTKTEKCRNIINIIVFSMLHISEQFYYDFTWNCCQSDFTECMKCFSNRTAGESTNEIKAGRDYLGQAVKYSTCRNAVACY